MAAKAEGGVTERPAGVMMAQVTYANPVASVTNQRPKTRRGELGRQ